MRELSCPVWLLGGELIEYRKCTISNRAGLRLAERTVRGGCVPRQLVRPNHSYKQRAAALGVRPPRLPGGGVGGLTNIEIADGYVQAIMYPAAAVAW